MKFIQTFISIQKLKIKDVLRAWTLIYNKVCNITIRWLLLRTWISLKLIILSLQQEQWHTDFHPSKRQESQISTIITETMEEKVLDPDIKSTMKIIKTRIASTVAVLRWAVGAAAFLKTGSMRTRMTTVSMNHSGRKLIMLQYIRCILKEFHLRSSKKLRKIGWKREPGKINFA